MIDTSQAAWERLGARRSLEPHEWPVVFEPLTHGAPEEGVQVRAALPHPRARASGVVAVEQRVDVDAPDHVAAGQVEHRVREPLPGAEVVGVALQVRAVLVPRHLSRPGAVGKPGRRRDVLHRRCPGVVVELVVLRPERLEDELGSLETERDVEVGRDELGHATNRRTSAQQEPGRASSRVTRSGASPAAPRLALSRRRSRVRVPSLPSLLHKSLQISATLCCLLRRDPCTAPLRRRTAAEQAPASSGGDEDPAPCRRNRIRDDCAARDVRGRRLRDRGDAADHRRRPTRTARRLTRCRAPRHLAPISRLCAISFATIGIIWVNHHVVLAQVARADRAFLFLTLALLLSVAFIPFPTRVLAEFVRTDNGQAAALLYGFTMLTMSAAFLSVWLYASAVRRLLRPDADPKAISGITRSFLPGLPMYVAATLVALVSPAASAALFGLLALFYVVSTAVLGRSAPAVNGQNSA